MRTATRVTALTMAFAILLTIGVGLGCKNHDNDHGDGGVHMDRRTDTIRGAPPKP